MRDLNDKVTTNTLTASEWNDMPSELQNIIENLGITLSGADLNQVGKAMAGYVANGAFYSESGVADAYVLTAIGLKQSPPAYADGFEVSFIPGNTNTGASTINVATIGVKTLADIAGNVLAAGVLPTDRPIRAYYNLAADEFRVLVTRFESKQWILAAQVGNSLAVATVGSPALAALNGTDVAFIDATNDDLRTYRFDGTDWAQVGNDLNIATVGSSLALAALNGTDVAFIDATNNSLRTYRFDGTDWAQIGNSLAISSVNFPVLTSLNSTDIAFFDTTNEDLRTYRFNGTDWVQIGNDLNISGVGVISLSALNEADVAFFDTTDDNLRTYRFNGTDWAKVSNDLNIAGAGTPALAALNGTDVAFIDATQDALRAYRFSFYTGAGPYRP